MKHVLQQHSAYARVNVHNFSQILLYTYSFREPENPRRFYGFGAELLQKGDEFFCNYYKRGTAPQVNYYERGMKPRFLLLQKGDEFTFFVCCNLYFKLLRKGDELFLFEERCNFCVIIDFKFNN